MFQNCVSLDCAKQWEEKSKAMIGTGIITLFIYIGMIIVPNVAVKRSMGESMLWSCLVMLIIGGVYLIIRKVINWHTPVAYIGTVAVLTFLFPKAGSGVEWMLYSLFGGGLMLGAFFMATDYATSPVTKKGQLIFGVGCGLFTVLIRYFGSYNEGVCYSIMVMNLFVPFIDKYTKPVRFGVVKSDKGGTAK